MMQGKEEKMQGNEEKKRKENDIKMKSRNLEIAIAAEWRAFSSFLTSEFEGAKEGLNIVRRVTNA